MNFKVVGVGEVLWDLLPEGPQLGGAPANFAYHAYALGARVQVITCIGNDDYGREIIRRFHDMGLPDDTVQVDPDWPTGTATVTLSGNGSLISRFRKMSRGILLREPRRPRRGPQMRSALGAWRNVPELSREAIQHLSRRRLELHCASSTSICDSHLHSSRGPLKNRFTWRMW